MYNYIYFFCVVSFVRALNPFFNEWHCIGIRSKIDISKPFTANIGELPLVIWNTNNKREDTLCATLNVCRHMGSKLDTGIVDNGCLKCPYHGLEHSKGDKIGEVMIHEGKIFWSYKPKHKTPYSTPFYYNKEYVTSVQEVTMPCSLRDSAYNTMDLRHPEYVHNGLFGFGNNIPPTDIKVYEYDNKHKMKALSFLYKSTSFASRGVNSTDNFHLFRYPAYTWSKVSVGRYKHLIISAHFTPISEKKTKWYVTACHNYFKTDIQTKIMKTMASIILHQDHKQMKRQYPENELKKEVMFNHDFGEDDEAILWLRDLYDAQDGTGYSYPSTADCVELYKDNRSS